MLFALVSKRALTSDARDRPMRIVTHRIVTHPGTRFTGAEITSTALSHSDVSEVLWEPAKGPIRAEYG